jgi:hypothetical protein
MTRQQLVVDNIKENWGRGNLLSTLCHAYQRHRGHLSVAVLSESSAQIGYRLGKEEVLHPQGPSQDFLKWVILFVYGELL